MKGEIRCSSRLNQGSVFSGYVLFGKAESKGEEARTTTTPNLPALRVLVAEDNPINRKLVARMLTDFGILFEMAENGEEAVTIFQAHQSNIDLILMDIQMPSLSFSIFSDKD